MHHHLHRGWGLSSATIFNWAYCVDSPNAPSNKKLAEHTERFNYDKSVYKYYKSATIHTHKKRIPKNLFFIIFGVILFGYFAVKMLFFNDNFFSKVYGVEQKSTKKHSKMMPSIQHFHYQPIIKTVHKVNQSLKITMNIIKMNYTTVACFYTKGIYQKITSSDVKTPCYK